jgi:hypothetical protein
VLHLTSRDKWRRSITDGFFDELRSLRGILLQRSEYLHKGGAGSEQGGTGSKATQYQHPRCVANLLPLAIMVNVNALVISERSINAPYM